MADDDCAGACCGLCCVTLFSALSPYCNTIAPASCRCCPAKTESAYEEAVRKDMAKSKAEDEARKQTQTQPTPTPAMSTEPQTTVTETKEG